MYRTILIVIHIWSSLVLRATCSSNCYEEVFFSENKFKCAEDTYCQWIGTPDNTVEVVSVPLEYSARCSQDSYCEQEFSVESTQKSSLELAGNAGLVFDLVWKQLKNLVSIFNYTWSWGYTKKQVVSCQVKPGYEGNIWLNYHRLRLKGRVKSALRRSGCFQGLGGGGCWTDSPVCKESDYETSMPIGYDGELKGYLECKYKPIANVTHEWYQTNQEHKLTQNSQFEAVEEALKQLLTNPPAMGQMMVQTGERGGQRAWSQAKCYHLSDHNTYLPICRACLEHVIGRLLAENKQAAGARIMVADCYVRYEMYELSRLDSPKSSSSIVVPTCGTNNQWWFEGPNCRQYYDCTSGTAKLMSCGSGLAWKQERKLCDHPSNEPRIACQA